MASLILLGNRNLATFSNSIVAANGQARSLFNRPLDHIFAIHSDESFAEISRSFQLERQDWVAHLQSHMIDHRSIIHRVVPISAQQADIDPFVGYLNIVIRGLDDSASLIVDLTNSTTLYKNILSIAAHILDLHHQYFIDTQTLAGLTESRGYIAGDILKHAYFPAPNGERFDDIGYLSLTEIVRYRQKIDQQTAKYLQIGGKDADGEFFRNNLEHSIRMKLRNDQQIEADSALYRIATSSALVSIDDLVRLVLSDHGVADELTFGKRLLKIEHLLAQHAPASFDMPLIRKLNALILYLRNSTTHKTTYSHNMERYKAELTTQVIFAFSELYAEIVAPTIREHHINAPTRVNLLERPDDAQSYYLGLDGDDTGTHVENEILAARSDDQIRQLSHRISEAINVISSRIKGSHRFGKQAIIMNAGDNVLFYGKPNMAVLRELQRIYKTETDGLTCSIGYGTSLRAAYIALKLAKAEPGKEGIIGIELMT